MVRKEPSLMVERLTVVESVLGQSWCWDALVVMVLVIMPREFTAFLQAIVYIPPTLNNTDRNGAFCEMYLVTIQQETAHPDTCWTLL